MEAKVPRIRENADYEQTLWDHLYLMSSKQLDIDWPYDVSDAEKIHLKPQPLPLPQNSIKLRHYGRLVEELTEKLKTMPEGAERDELVRITAMQMKRNLMTWGHGSVDDEKVADDLARYTDGKIQIDLANFHLDRVQAIGDNEPRRGRRRR
jgi:hypothetical protein